MGSATSASGSDPTPCRGVVAEIETYAAQFLTEASITDLLMPTVQDVLARGRPELVSVGFLLSLWAGSRALNVFIDTVSIMYGQKDVRGIIQLRALSLSLYTVGTLAGIVLLPVVLLGPSIIGAVCRRSSTSCATSTGRRSSS